MICIWSTWCHCHPITFCSSKIHSKIHNLSGAGLPRLPWKKRPWNGCSSVVVLSETTLHWVVAGFCRHRCIHTLQAAGTKSGKTAESQRKPHGSVIRWYSWVRRRGQRHCAEIISVPGAYSRIHSTASPFDWSPLVTSGFDTLQQCDLVCVKGF